MSDDSSSAMTVEGLAMQACADNGLRGEKSTDVDGKKITDVDIARATAKVYFRVRSRPLFAPVMGESKREEKKRRKAMKRQVLKETSQELGIPVSENVIMAALTLAVAAIMVTFAGPQTLLLSVASVIFEHLFSGDIDKIHLFNQVAASLPT